MAFIDILQQAGNIPEAHYIKFLHQYKFNDKTLHFFFEGLDDQSFYANFLENMFPQEYRINYYVCNGKDNVYTIHSDINWAVYNKSRALFFTDKDLDDILGVVNPKDVNIFETKYYSIENYLVTEDVYRRFLREICYITDSEVIDNLCSQFTTQLNAFSKLMVSISAWVVYCRENNYDVTLGDIDISKIFEINSDFKVKRKVTSEHKSPFEYICSCTKTAYFNLQEVKRISAKLKTIQPAKIFLRGKYELWFLYAFCKATIDITVPALNAEIKKHNKTNSAKMTKCKVTISLKPENILQIAAPRVKLSQDVRDFISLHVNNLQGA